MRVIIAGGGVGGLTLALMLHRRGIEAVVLEAAAEVRPRFHTPFASSRSSDCCRIWTRPASEPAG